MEQPEDDELVRSSAARLYGEGQPIWDPSDRWNVYKRAKIDQFAREYATKHLGVAGIVLDAGCGSEPYEWLPDHTISLDRFWPQARGRTWPVAADLTQLPFRSASIGFIVCVASVLNYVSAAEALAELGRVTKPGGSLLLHFETSTSLEQLARARWGAPVVRLATMNNGREDTLWIYRPSYIRRLLNAAGFQVRRERRFHILSALGLRLGFDQQKAARLAAFDRLLPWAGDLADDIILIAEKRASTPGEAAGGRRKRR
jgi:SAM-dependent methyltransferase